MCTNSSDNKFKSKNRKIGIAIVNIPSAMLTLKIIRPPIKTRIHTYNKKTKTEEIYLCDLIVAIMSVHILNGDSDNDFSYS